MSRLTGFSPLVRNRVKERSGGFCEIEIDCFGDVATAQHHRRPRGAGGTRRPETNQAANALATCQACHEWVESRRAMALGVGWLLPQHRHPADVPVVRRGVWVLLADNGDIQEIPEPAGGKVA